MTAPAAPASAGRRESGNARLRRRDDGWPVSRLSRRSDICSGVGSGAAPASRPKSVSSV